MAFIENVKSLILNPLMVLLVALSILYFLYGISEFMYTGEVKKIEEGKKHILWGLVGLFIALTYSGIMKLVEDTVKSLTQ